MPSHLRCLHAPAMERCEVFLMRQNILSPPTTQHHKPSNPPSRPIHCSPSIHKRPTKQCLKLSVPNGEGCAGGVWGWGHAHAAQERQKRGRGRKERCVWGGGGEVVRGGGVGPAKVPPTSTSQPPSWGGREGRGWEGQVQQAQWGGNEGEGKGVGEGRRLRPTQNQMM